MIRLQIHTGSLAGREITTAASLIRLGRDPSRNDLILTDDEQVSARHAMLQRAPRGTYVLEDLGSTNGTTINDRKIINVGRPTAVYLSAGDRFQVGRTLVEVRDGLARVHVIEGPRTGLDLVLDERLLSIGRAPDNVLALEDPEVSAYHAAIRCTPLGFVLEDQGSTNGCTVNGERIKSHTLSDGDEVFIGKTRLRFLVDDLEPAADTAAAVATTADAPGSFAKLVFVAGPAEGRTMSLGDDQLVLGRRDDVGMQLPDELISSVHCAFTRDGGHYVLTDLGSRNGTFVNGQEVRQGTVLQPGDLVALGNTVIEYRITGGGTHGAGLTAMTTVMAEGAYQLETQPKFVVGGNVIAAPHVTIGRGPSCDLRIEGLGVSKEHCRIVWHDGFMLEDQSTHGTYVADRRVVRERLAAEQVVRIGVHLINVSVRGDRCTLTAIDAAQALAAIEVARAEAQVLQHANLELASPDESPRFGALGGGYKTMFQLPVVDTDALIRERKDKLRKGAPAWRPSTDIAPEPFGKVAVSSAVAASIAVAVFLVLSSDAGALMNHPLGEAHASVAFGAQAESVGLRADCTACHTVGDGIDQDKCARCHDGFAGNIRAGHAAKGPGARCASCHREHRGQARFIAAGVPSHLGATSTCAAGGCHPSQHSREFLRQGPPPPQVIAAGPVKDFRMPQRDFHVAHAVVEHDGKSIAIGCTACHATTVAGGALVEASPGQACFRCHQGGEEHVAGQCSACHADEHGGAAVLERRPAGDLAMAPARAQPSPGLSLAWGGVLAFAAFIPLAFVSLHRRVRRRQRARVVVEELRTHPVEMVKRLIHSINNDKCVGCAMCVQACPASVLELVNHRSRVVNFDACIQCKKCEEVCAFDALRMHEADKSPPMVSMPEVDANYETQVKGLYLIGQASGTPQVKNASNLGRAVVQHAATQGFVPGSGRSVGAELDFVIVGSGPAGLSAGLTCAKLGYSYVVLEKERNFSWTIRNYYHKGKPVMAEPNDVELVGLLPHWDTTREALLDAWDQVIAREQLDLRLNHTVAGVAKDGERFKLTVTDRGGQPLGEITAGRVVLAIGTMGNPRKLGCAGEDHVKVKNALVDPDEWTGKNVLVVGGTDSAIEVVLALCDRNKVWLSSRGAKFDRVKPKNLKLIEEIFAAGKCIPMWATAVAEVTPDGVILEHKQDGRKETLPNDAVFAMIGGHPPIKWLQSVGIGYVDKPHSWSPPRTDELAHKTAGPQRG